LAGLATTGADGCCELGSGLEAEILLAASGEGDRDQRNNSQAKTDVHPLYLTAL
jgi:hypothetical protein